MSVEDLKGQWITLIGTGSIQEYVFGTNRLKENAGASELVAQALDYWKGKGEIFVGGGNAALLFQDEPKLIAAIESWSREMLEKAPNLRLLAAHAQIGESFRDAYHDAKRILLDSENAPPFGAELGQLPVVRECASTGRAANIEGKNHSWLSVESLRKQEAGEISHRGVGEK